MVTNSSQEVIDSYESSTRHFYASPINEKGNNLNQTDSWEMLLK